jgi:general nucleoside transport system permease protein
MTTPEQESTVPVPEGGEPQRGAGWGRRLLDIYTVENTPVVTLFAIVFALAVGAILIVISDSSTMAKAGYFFSSPSDFLSSAWGDISNAYSNLFKGAIFDPATVNGTPAQFFGPITNTLEFASPLIFGGLAVSVAFRAGMFNIGGQGQTIVGAILAAWVSFSWTALPGPLHVAVAILAGIVGGLVYGGVVGWLKSRRGAHEVIVTIMLNYVAALFLTNYLLNASGFHDASKAGQPISKPASHDSILPHLFGDQLNTDIGLVLALLATFAVAWFFKRSTLGFEVRAVGLNPTAARTAGIDVGRVQIAAMVISGALMGMIGVTQVLGLANPSNNAVTPTIDAGLGFTSITVSLLGRTKPWGVVWAALLFGAFQAGGAVMQTQGVPQVSNEIITVLEALIVIFVAAPRLIREVFRLRSKHRHDAVAPGGDVVAAVPGAQTTVAGGQI